MPPKLDPTSRQFQKQVATRFREHREGKFLGKGDDLCLPKSYTLHPPQKFLAEYVSDPRIESSGVLAAHGIGSCKTCTSIQVREALPKEWKALVIVPASLRDNYREELRGRCAGDLYVSEKDRALIDSLLPGDSKREALIEKANRKIDRRYTIVSYQRFVKDADRMKLNNTLIIIDEAHNMINERGTHYRTLLKTIDRLKQTETNYKLLLLSATPIFDHPSEIAPLLNLLLPYNKQMQTGRRFDKEFMTLEYNKQGQPITVTQNMDVFKSYLNGLISYYRGAPSAAFPRTSQKIVRVKMSDLQVQTYQRILEEHAALMASVGKEPVDGELPHIPNNFLIGTRMVSNIAFPNGMTGEEGFKSLKKRDLTPERIGLFAPKIAAIWTQINKCKRPSFIYSAFRGYGGIETMAKFLDAQGYQDYQVAGAGPKRYGIWSGETSTSYKSEMKAVYNRKDNVDGSLIRFMLGSPAIKEGVSLLRSEQAHLMDIPWNEAMRAQIIGRINRFCSHKDLPEKDRFTEIYTYCAYHPSIELSADERILQIATEKGKLVEQFMQAIRESAIDCELFQGANSRPGMPVTCRPVNPISPTPDEDL